MGGVERLTGLPGEQVLGLEGGDVGHGGEDVGAVDDRSFDAVALVDAAVARLLVQYELHTIIRHNVTQLALVDAAVARLLVQYELHTSPINQTSAAPHIINTTVVHSIVRDRL